MSVKAASKSEAKTSGPACTKCKSTDVKHTGARSTEEYYVSEVDDQGRIHRHDGNAVTDEYKCNACKTKFEIVRKTAPCAIPDCIWGRDHGKEYVLKPLSSDDD
jgi:cytochrome c551/c552